MTKLAFVFRTPPYGSSSSREGLDTLLAATAFCNEEDISVFFIEDGVFNLLAHQQPEKIHQKDFIRTFKLLELNEIEQRYLCEESVVERDLADKEIILPCHFLKRADIIEKLQSADKIFTF
ncbi:sulfurtransferase complex subunit TusC [Actinobacillus porcinus]|uniref:sulfurtransferase complex subunit TusC n=1 Tax=Actinobacillus porcinus TaxID=51048 RepID=UPI002352B829|nr:sulfurtransferase complex subunit TusC [Actinobacillus porcinus]